MYLHFSNITSLPDELTQTKYFFDSSEEDLSVEFLNKKLLFKIGRVNFLIGSNNSGKSRFLRGLLKLDKRPENINLLKTSKYIDHNFEDFKSSNWISYYRRSRQFGYLPNNLNYNESVEKFYNKIHNGDLTVFNLVLNNHTFTDYFNAIELLHYELKNSHRLNIREELNQLLIIVEKFIELKKQISFFLENLISECIYIPTLRNSIKSDSYDNSIFEKTIKKLYNFDKEKIYTGQNLYEEVLKVRNSLKEKRKGFEMFEKFLSQNFFNNHDLEIIADLEYKQLMLFVNGDERKIQDVGDGIQQIILLLFPIYTSLENSWLLIEEPETHLHPGLQRLFIETLLNDKYLKKKNLRYFFTTHSNHFLDLSLLSDETSIFQFNKENQNKFNIKDVKPSRETLDLLGVNNSSVLMANSSIWVEGPTDRKYISKIIKLFCKFNNLPHLKENLDFAFFEYGGNLISHYLFDKEFDSDSMDSVSDKIFSFSLSNRIYLLADNDNADYRTAKGKRRKKLEKLSNNVNFKYQNTIYKEIENLLSVKIIKDFLLELVKTSEISKIDGIKFKREDYTLIGLGDFIESLFKKYEITDFKSFRDDSGTLKSTYKTKLCDFVINGNYTYEDLIFENEQLEEIIKNLYSFIKPK